MAKSITFTIKTNAVALRIRNKVCAYNGYEKNKLPDETKNEFFRRVTINLWAGQVAAQENREEHEAKQAEINAFDITSSEV